MSSRNSVPLPKFAEDLGALPGTDPSVTAYAINDLGQTVGVDHSQLYGSDTIKIDSTALLWGRGEPPVQIGGMVAPDLNFYRATDINNRGDVVGIALLGSEDRAVLWNANDGIQVLEAPAEPLETCASAVNDRRQVIGVYWKPLDDRSSIPMAFVWSEATGTETLSLELHGKTAIGSYASDINDAGVIVGWMFFQSEIGESIHGVTWWPDGSVVELIPGAENTRGRSINNKGQVLGRILGDSREYFLWDRVAGAENLNSILKPTVNEWDIVAITAINDAGQIAGWASTSDDATHAILLNPIPEPSSRLTALIGIACSAAWMAVLCRGQTMPLPEGLAKRTERSDTQSFGPKPNGPLGSARSCAAIARMRTL